MNNIDFKELFDAVLEKSRAAYEIEHSVKIPSAYKIEFHGYSMGGAIISVSEALDLMYKGNGRFHLIIDVVVNRYDEKFTYFFVRPSGHELRPFDQTWRPKEFGPFHILSDFVPKD